MTLQDSHCLVTVSECNDEEYTTNAGGIANCEDADEGVCYECVYGYAVSSNKKSCVRFQNCYRLEEGDKKCKDCYYNFQPNSNGQCERTLCKYYENNECKKCYDGYYLKNNECKKITIPYCLEVEESDETKCSRCLWILPEPVNGTCISPTTWVIGCEEYNTEGKCVKCYEDYTKNGDKCNFISCTGRAKKVDYCDICEPGFTDENNNEGLCVGFDGTKDNTANTAEAVFGNKIQFALLIFILALVI